MLAANTTPTGKNTSQAFEVKIKVNGKEVGQWKYPEEHFETLLIEGGTTPLPQGASSAVVEFTYTGKGTCSFGCRLFGTIPHIEAVRNFSYSIEHENFYHSPILYKGKTLIQSEQIVTSVHIEDYVEDSTSFTSFDDGVYGGDYVVVRKAIPSGMIIDESTIPQSAAGWFFNDGELHLVFKGKPSDFRLGLMPAYPGKFRLLPASIRNLSGYESDTKGEERVIEIVESEERIPKYEWSGKEHLAFGEAMFNDQNYVEAIEHLNELSPQDRKVHSSAAKALLWIYCTKEFYNASQVVELFETIERHHRSILIPYEIMGTVGKAYHDTGEFEAAAMLWRSILKSSFRDELPVARELEESGEYTRSVGFLEDLYWSYPDEPSIIEAYYGLSQDIYAHSNTMELTSSLQGLSKNDIVELAAEVLVRFLSLHKELPYSDQATFSLLSAYLELGLDADCIALSSNAIEHYYDSEYNNRFKYLKALAAFNLSKYDLALDSAREVADCDSDESAYATYILGQMYQAMGQMDEALEAYQKVRNDFSEAEMSIDYIERQSLSIDEVVTGEPGDSITMNLTYCNALEIEVLAYKVDLMRLFLKEKNLDRIASVKLAGITPSCTFKRELPGILKGSTGKTTISLPFEETGAYLVLIRSGQVFASGLALITPLSIEVQESQNAVRATILEGKDKIPLRNVLVKASNGDEFENGMTDLRGAVTIEIERDDEITVVARRGTDEYAFFPQ